MCDDCDRQKEKVIDEMKQLLEMSGDFWDEISEDWGSDDPAEMDVERMEAIALRCAFAAGFTRGSSVHGERPSLILLAFTGKLASMEIQVETMEDMRNRLGMNEN